MTLNVNLEDVPDAILEAVIRRILASRRKMQDQQQLQDKPALQPKPQVRKQGADSKTWKRPEPAATLVSDQAFNVASCYFNFNTENNTLTVSTSNSSASTTASVPTATNANYTDLFWWVCLPAGNDKMVLAFYFVSDGVKVRFESRTSYSETVPFTTQLDSAAIIADAEAIYEQNQYQATRADLLVTRLFPTTDCFIGPQPFFDRYETLEENNEFGTGKIYTPSRNTIPVEITSSEFIDTLLTFVVTKNSVTQVEPPQQLRSVLFDKFITAEGVITNEGVHEITVENREFVNRTFAVQWFWYDWNFSEASPSCEVAPRFDRLQQAGPIEIGRRENITYFTTETEPTISARLAFSDGNSCDGLLRSYGYGFLVDRQDGQSEGWGWTPAVFAFLRKFDAPSDLDTNYQSVKNRYLGNDATRLALTLGYQQSNSQADTTSNYYYFNIPTESSADFDDPVDFDSSALNLRRVTAGTRVNPIQSPDLEETQGVIYDEDNPVKAWDWGKPNACIGELMALGFTAEQLGYAGQTAPAGFSFDS
jgi:hypothetical protein